MANKNFKTDLAPDEKLLMAVVRAAETFKRIVSSILRKYDISFPQYNVLRVLDASKDGKCKIKDICRVMLVPNANITGISKRLEKNGLILRKSDPNDERVTILEITDKGKKTLEAIEKSREENMHAMLNGFTEEEKRLFLNSVKRLLKNCRKIS